MRVRRRRREREEGDEGDEGEEGEEGDEGEKGGTHLRQNFEVHDGAAAAEHRLAAGSLQTSTRTDIGA